MVRNIDLPEAIVFYGQDVFCHRDNNSSGLQLLPGVTKLLQECRDIETPVVIIDMIGDFNNTMVEMMSAVSVYNASSLPPPPNPRALFEAIQTLIVQPRGFGGSSGFGRARTADPSPRIPLFQHTVVLCNSIEACRAARYVGTRCISKIDVDLADAVVDEWDEIVTVDDIATPGSFWLNPPHPKDDEGNRVDIYELMDYYDKGEQSATIETTESTMSPLSMGDDDELSRILADLDTL
jgi:hypothetical protein